MPEISRFFGIIISMYYGLLMEWAFQHQEELMNNWESARKEQPLSKIKPLI